MLHAQFYSTKPLPRNFSFTADPYESDEARKVMSSAGIFFYRDENHTSGIVVDAPADGFTKAFYGQCILDETSGFKVDEFVDPPASYREKHGDTFAWILYNKEQIVLEVREGYVKVQ
jgi:hypothetical protein